MNTLLLQFTLTPMTCGECGIAYAMPSDFCRDRQRDHGTFYCPRGHARYFPGKSDLEREQEARAEAERLAQWERNRADMACRRAVSAEQSRRVTKGHLTRIKRRVAAGVCPCCRRTFTNMARHMKRQHPEFSGGEG